MMLMTAKDCNKISIIAALLFAFLVTLRTVHLSSLIVKEEVVSYVPDLDLSSWSPAMLRASRSRITELNEQSRDVHRLAEHHEEDSKNLVQEEEEEQDRHSITAGRGGGMQAKQLGLRRRHLQDSGSSSTLHRAASSDESSSKASRSRWTKLYNQEQHKQQHLWRSSSSPDNQESLVQYGGEEIIVDFLSISWRDLLSLFWTHKFRGWWCACHRSQLDTI